jgi:hypothetical protein
MKPPRVRWNTTEARVERFVRMAQRLGLPVFGFEVRGRDVTVLTHPRESGSPAPQTGPDAVERWFRDNRPGRGSAHSGVEKTMKSALYSLDSPREQSVRVRWGTEE